MNIETSSQESKIPESSSNPNQYIQPNKDAILQYDHQDVHSIYHKLNEDNINQNELINQLYKHIQNQDKEIKGLSQAIKSDGGSIPRESRQPVNEVNQSLSKSNSNRDSI